MGGNAFKDLSATSFPRLPPAVYESLKARILPILRTLYVEVAVPAEAPEKSDYGDLDLIVCTPRKEVLKESPDGTLAAMNVPHEQVKEAIGAKHCILEVGNRTSNFAVPVVLGEWFALGCGTQEEDYRRLAGEDGEIYYQVDIHVCSDISEWKRIVFFHGYGDLGMIMGLVAKNVGLHLGETGLKYPQPPHPTVLLTDSLDDASKFFGWSMQARNAGFKTRHEIYEWIATSRFFEPTFFRTSGQGIKRVKADRTMYADFVRWAELLVSTSALAPASDGDIEMRREQVRQEALMHFGKKVEVDSYLSEFETRKKLKVVFNGTNVSSWTGLGNNWKAVKKIMDLFRAENGGEEGIVGILQAEGEEGLKQRLLKVFNDPSITIS